MHDSCDVTLFYSMRQRTYVPVRTHSVQPHEREYRPLWELSASFGLKICFVLEKSKGLKSETEISLVSGI